MQDDRTVAIPLTKKSSDEQYTRFVGEYVDETYLQLLADNPDSGSFSISELDAEELFIPQTYTFNNFALAYASNVDDEDFKERIKKRAEQEAKDRYLYLENLFGDTSSSGSELSKTCEGIDASLQAFENEIKQRVKEGTLTEAEAQASLAEIEAQRADISLDSLRAPIDADDTWIAAIDDPYFTGEDPDIGVVFAFIVVQRGKVLGIHAARKRVGAWFCGRFCDWLAIFGAFCHISIIRRDSRPVRSILIRNLFVGNGCAIKQYVAGD